MKKIEIKSQKPVKPAAAKKPAKAAEKSSRGALRECTARVDFPRWRVGPCGRRFMRRTYHIAGRSTLP